VSHVIDEACTGCNACARQCPTAAISGQLGEQYVIEPALCIDCSVCGIICPEEAVTDERDVRVKRVRRDLRSRPVVNPLLCNGCTLCVEICPFDCLTIVGVPFQGGCYLSVPQACVSCADCERICIKGAIIMRPVNLRELDPAEEARKMREALGLPPARSGPP